MKDIWLINSYKVEKSFWQTPWLSDDNLRENLTLGLEQARDTVMPQVHIRKLFKPFVEDELPALLAGKRALVAHPGTDQPCPTHMDQPTALCIGPEGGFTPYEVGKLEEAGCDPVHWATHSAGGDGRAGAGQPPVRCLWLIQAERAAQSFCSGVITATSKAPAITPNTPSARVGTMSSGTPPRPSAKWWTAS